MTIRVLIADDQALVRGSFRLLIESAPDMTVVGEAANGVEAVSLARAEQPDVILMDIRMPDMDGIEATSRISRDVQTANVRVLILTTFDLDDHVYAALRAGASGYLLKDVRPVDLLAGVQQIAEGEGLLAPTVTRRLIEEFSRRPRPGNTLARDLDRLTEREHEVLLLIATGLSNLELAAHLHLSMATIKTHIGRLLAKLNARDRAQLVIVAYENGLIAPRHIR